MKLMKPEITSEITSEVSSSRINRITALEQKELKQKKREEIINLSKELKKLSSDCISVSKSEVLIDSQLRLIRNILLMTSSIINLVSVQIEKRNETIKENIDLKEAIMLDKFELLYKDTREVVARNFSDKLSREEINEKDTEPEINGIFHSEDFKIGYTPEGFIKIDIEFLLPKRNSCKQSNYLFDKYKVLIKHAIRKREIERFTEPHYIIYNHCYNNKKSEKLCRDVDNVEIKTITDVISLLITGSDGPFRCRQIQLSSRAEEDRTEIYIVPFEKLIDFFQTYVDK